MSRTRPLQVLDVLVVLALAVSALVQVWAASAASLVGGRAVHVVLVLAVTLPLLLRRRHPATVFLVVYGAAWLQGELGGDLGQPWFAVLLALYAVGAHASMPGSLAGPLAVLALVAIDVPRLLDGASWDEIVPAWFILLGAWALGRWVRSRTQDTTQLRERVAASEREAEEQASRAVAEERARIARELHDLVAHSMGVIVIQAQGAERALDGRPDEARRALRSIESAGRAALEEMRRMLGLLTGPADNTTAPQPSLSSLATLADHVRQAGLSVDLTVDGEVRPLPAGVELAGYRVVQEAMTNALKHADASRLDVRVHYLPTCLEIRVQDDGTRASSENGQPASGRGLVGMRERVSLYGGTLRTGRLDGAGFGVHARIPLATPEATA